MTIPRSARRRIACSALACLLCLWAVSAAAQETGVSRVATTAGAVFVQEDAVWWELDAEGTRRFRFEEVGRDATRVFLHDPSRDVHLDLDVAGATVWYAAGDAEKVPLYAIASIESAAPKTGTAEPVAEPEGAPVTISLENRTGAVLELLRPEGGGEFELVGRAYPDTELETEMFPGEWLEVGAGGLVFAGMQVEGPERLRFDASVLDAVGILAEAELDIRNHSAETVTVLVFVSNDGSQPLSEVDAGAAVTATLPVGTLVRVVSAEGEPLGDHVVIPDAAQVFDIGEPGAS